MVAFFLSFSGDGGIGAPFLLGKIVVDLVGPIARFSDTTILLVGRGKDHPLNHDGPTDEPDASIGVAFSGVAAIGVAFIGVVAFCGIDFIGVTFSGVAVIGVTFIGVAFIGVTFNGVAFSGVAFSGVTFNGVAFSGVAFSGVAFIGVAFSGVTFSGVAFIGVAFIGVTFIGVVGRAEDFVGEVTFVDTEDGREIVGDGFAVEGYAVVDGRAIGTGTDERESDGDV